MGFGAKPEEPANRQAKREERIQSAVKKHLRPELVNRLSAIVHFQPLESQHIREILDKCVAALNTRLMDRGITLSLGEDVVELIAREGFSPEYGARELERVFECLVSKPLAELILKEGLTSGILVAGIESGRVVFSDDGVHPQA